MSLLDDVATRRLGDCDAVIAEMYDSICFEEGHRPNWQWQERIFAPNARLVRITDDGVFEFDLRSYRENIEGMIDSGQLASFWEGELWRETRQVGEMAHVLSAYETRRSRGGEVLNRGVNSIQLFQRDGRWWVSALLWRREGEAPATRAFPHCSFCNKSQRDVKKLIAGPNVYICDECVDICADIIVAVPPQSGSDSSEESPEPRPMANVAANCSICRLPFLLGEGLHVETRGVLCRACVQAVQAALAP